MKIKIKSNNNINFDLFEKFEKQTEKINELEQKLKNIYKKISLLKYTKKEEKEKNQEIENLKNELKNFLKEYKQYKEQLPDIYNKLDNIFNNINIEAYIEPNLLFENTENNIIYKINNIEVITSLTNKINGEEIYFPAININTNNINNINNYEIYSINNNFNNDEESNEEKEDIETFYLKKLVEEMFGIEISEITKKLKNAIKLDRKLTDEEIDLLKEKIRIKLKEKNNYVFSEKENFATISLDLTDVEADSKLLTVLKYPINKSVINYKLEQIENILKKLPKDILEENNKKELKSKQTKSIKFKF